MYYPANAADPAGRPRHIAPLASADGVNSADRLAGALASGRSLIVFGESGMGKSYLADGIVRQLKGHGHEPIAVRATALVQHLPYAALRSALELRVPETPGTPPATTPATTPAPTPALVLARLNQRSGNHKPIVLVDDAHLLDSATAELLCVLVTAGSITLLLTAILVPDKDPSPDAAQTLRTITDLWVRQVADRIDIAPLSAPAADALVSELCDGAPLDLVTRIGVRERSAGSPLLLRELTRYALEGGLAVENHDTLTLHSAPPPARIIDILRGRLSALTPAQLHGLAVLGRVRSLPYNLSLSLFSGAGLRDLVLRGFAWQDHRGGSLVSAHQLYAECAMVLGDPAAIAGLEQALGDAVLAEVHHGRVITDSEAVVIDGCWAAGSTLGIEAGRHGAHTVAAVLVGAARHFNSGGYAGAALDAAWRAYEFDRSIAAVIEYSRALAATRKFTRALAVLVDAESTLTSAEEAVHLIRWWTKLASRQPVAPLELEQLAARAANWGFASDELDGEIAQVKLTIAYRRLDRRPVAEFAESIAHTSRYGLLVCARAASLAAIDWSLLGESTRATVMSRFSTELLQSQAISASSVPDSDIEAFIFAYGILGQLLDGVSLDESLRELDRRIAAAVRARDYATLPYFSYAAGEIARFRGDAAAAVTEFTAGQSRYARSDPRGLQAYLECRLAATLADVGRLEEAYAVLGQAEASAEELGKHDWATGIIAYTAAGIAAGAASLGRAEAPAGTNTGTADAAPSDKPAGPHTSGAVANFPILALKLMYRQFVEGADPATIVDNFEAVATTLNSRLITAAAIHIRAALERKPSALDDAAAAFAELGSYANARIASESAAELHQSQGDRPAALLSRIRAVDFAAQAGQLPPGTEPGALSLTDLLTDREREVALLAADGLSNKKIATVLFVSVRTVESHIYQARLKLGSGSRSDLASILRTDRGPEPPL